MSGYWIIGGVFATIVTGGGGCGCGGWTCVWVKGLWKVIGHAVMAKDKSWLRPKSSSQQ